MTTTTAPDPTLQVPTLGLDEIRHHPANPRRNAVADQAMVESIRAQGINEPLMVAPAADGDGWVLVDGHRRWSGAGQAGLDRVPVNPRYDLVTEAQQIEVMVVTGLQKELLTPVEEAAAYEQLALIGMDDAAIAQATGFGVRRVRDRIKLNALTDGVRAGIHDGQLTLDDAAAFQEFADDLAATTVLQEAIGTPNFRQRVHSLRNERENRAAQAKTIADLVEHGGRQVGIVPGGMGGYYFVDDEDRTEHHGAVGLYNFTEPLNEQAGHDAGCLLFSVPESAYGGIVRMCATPTKHPEFRHHPRPDRAPTPDPVESEWEKNQAAREAEKARRVAASAARLDWLRDHFAPMFPTKSHQSLGAAMQATLPLLLADTREVPDLTVLANAVSVDPDDGERIDEALARFGDTVADLTPTRVLTTFGHYLAAMVLEQFDAEPHWLDTPTEVHRVLNLWDWARSAGYQLCDVDVEDRARLESRLLELTAGDD